MPGRGFHRSRRLILLPFLGLWFFAIFYQSCQPQETDENVAKIKDANYVGSTTCISCHSDQGTLWTGSHHSNSMLHAGDSSVLGDFSGVEVTLNGINYRFYKENGRFYIHTEGQDGKYADFEVKYTFGYHPLQQYMTELENGKIQAFRAAWDAKEEKWYHLNPDLSIDPSEWLHWTNRSMNWNSMCAECHSTNLAKNFETESDTYSTQWDEINVSCESCHGPGSNHIELVSEEDFDRNAFEDLFMEMTSGISSIEQVMQCAPCHSRRLTIADDYHPGDELFDHYVPEVLLNSHYHGDGQINDEVFVYGSFVQSKMFHNGVKCTDCHEPHSLELKWTGNELCLNCHEKKYDLKTHHFHPLETESANCVNCHMTGKLYMVNDYRRDHSFRIPRPDQTIQYNTPNACNTCHSDKTAEWAANQVEEWYGPQRKENHTDILLALGAGEETGLAEGLRLIENADEPSIVRATAISYLAGTPNPVILEVINRTLLDPEPIIRIESIKFFNDFSLEERKRFVLPLISDSLRSVRVTAAQLLVELPLNDIPPKYQDDFKSAVREFEYYLDYNADFKSGQLGIGNYHSRMGNPEEAEKAFKQSLKIDSLYNPARINLSLLYNSQGRNSEAVDLYQTVIALEPDYAPAYYSLGLLYAEMEEFAKASVYLDLAMKKDPQNLRIYFNYGIIMQNMGNIEEAERIFLTGLEVNPEYAELHHTLAILYLQNSMNNKAMKELNYLISRFPNNAQYIRWKQQIEQNNFQ